MLLCQLSTKPDMDPLIINLQKPALNLKPVKTLLKIFRLFPNVVAFLTVANVAQMFELHASKQFNPLSATEKIQVYSGFRP